MKFLKKIFKRSSDDDDDDDIGFDDDDDAPSTQVILDDDDDLDGNAMGGGAAAQTDLDDFDDIDGDAGDDPDFDEPSEDPDFQDAEDAPDFGDLDEDDESEDPDFGDDDDDPDFGDDDDDPDFGDDDDDGEDFDDADFEDFDDDYDDDEDDDEEGGGSKRRTMMFIAAGVGVLMLGVAGGAAFWFMGDAGETEVAEAQPLPEGAVQAALPPRAGSLNAVGSSNVAPSLNQAAAKAEPSGKTPAGGGGQAARSDRTNQAEQTEQADQASDAETEKADGPQQSATETKMASAATLGTSSLNALAGAGGAAQGLVIPSVTQASYRGIPDQAKRIPLANAPDRRLLETREGLEKPLPTTTKDGRRKPWEAYSRPLTGNEKGQRVGIMVTGLGLSRAATMAAILKLPGEVSLVFDPYAKDLDDWLLRARLAGHEVFVGLPMESENFPTEDPGPLALTTTVQVAENMNRLHQILSSFAGYVGAVSTMGSKFSTAEGQLKPILTELKKRGLMFVDGGVLARSAAPRIAAEIDLPRAKSNILLDAPPDSVSIKRKLNQLEKLIKQQSTAIGTARAYPSSIRGLAKWARGLSEKQLALVPVSAIANKQFIE